MAYCRILTLALMALCVCPSPLVAAETTEVAIPSDVQKILESRCVDCHGPDTQESDLRVDDLVNMVRGGKSGPAFVAGSADKSLIISAVKHLDEGLTMPPDEKLPKAEIEALTAWVNSVKPEQIAGMASQPFVPVIPETDLWSFQTIQKPNVPDVDGAIGTPVDAFVLAKLKEAGLVPVEQADKRTLIRRATFDLIGLPPTPDEVQAFINDESDDAFAKVIDRLLDSKHYGERWGRHWLDIARYADSNGLDENVAHGNAWRYRDYVIQSLNEDKPFDQFITEQIAGDLLEAASEAEQHEHLIATGFLTLGPKVLAESDEEKMMMDIIDEQIDTVGKAIMGLTLGCARCHDHKFDPILTSDYYALAGIFKSTRTMESLKRIAKWNENTIANEQQRADLAAHEQKIADKKAEIATAREQEIAKLKEAGTDDETLKSDKIEDKFSDEAKTQLKDLRAELKTLEDNKPTLPTAMGVADGDPVNVPIHVRGSHLSLGREIPRGIPVVLTEESNFKVEQNKSGRLDFAKWLVSPQNPLTARVMANRLWRWHFGRGLVATTDNFGELGAEPTHPELLDWLASELMEKGWSLKLMHRVIMLSQTYQRSSQFHTANDAIDTDNQLWWRQDVKRLEAEVIRDSLLAVGGLLNDKMGGSMLHVGNREFIFNHTSKDETSYDSNVRSIYLPVIRNNLYDGFSLFDYADASVPNGDRPTSTVAPQALYLMNSELVLTAAESLAKHLTDQFPEVDERIQALYLTAYGRPPQPAEVNSIQGFLQRSQRESLAPSDLESWVALCHTILAANEFLYIQ